MRSAGISSRNGASWYWSTWRAENQAPPHVILLVATISLPTRA
jgi:hypothetical protein